MAKKINRLNDEKVRTAKPKHVDRATHMYDGGGLILRIQPSGAKAWLFAFGLDRQNRQMGLGRYPIISLNTARQLRDEAYAQLVRGIDPIAERQRVKNAQRQHQVALEAEIADKANTFEARARDWYTLRQGSGKWRSKRTEDQVHEVLFGYAAPHLGHMPISTITVKHVQDLLTSVALKGKTDRNGKPTPGSKGSASMSALVKIYVVNVLEFGGSEINWRVKLKDYGHTPKAKEKPAFSPEKIRDVLQGCDKYLDLPTARAAKLLALTCVRGNELLGAYWSEFDLDGATWTIPPQRMKMKRAHTVTLSTQAVEVLRLQYAVTGSCRHGKVFPVIAKHSGANVERPSTFMTLASVNAFMAQKLGVGGAGVPIGERLTAHCFRHSFSTTANELALARPDVIEAALAHGDNNAIRATYNRAQYMAERRELMQKYADLVAPEQAEQPEPVAFDGPVLQVEILAAAPIQLAA